MGPVPAAVSTTDRQIQLQPRRHERPRPAVVLRLDRHCAAELAAEADRLERLELQAAAREWAARFAEVERADGLVRGSAAGCKLLVAARLLASGFRQHARGRWRKVCRTTPSPGPGTRISGG
jgi:hypothetical protein